MIPISTIQKRVLAIFLIGGFVAVAVASTAALSPSDSQSGVADGTPSRTVAATAWRDIELTDVETGEAFTIAGLAGNVVAIEPMAIWCGNCKRQQDNVKSAYSEIESSDVTYISLGIDPGENPQQLAKYADKRGYEWTFSQSPLELSRALSDIFGPQILSAPSTPLIVLDPDGEIVVQEFGFHGPEKLLGILEEAT